MDHRLWTIDQ